MVDALHFEALMKAIPRILRHNTAKLGPIDMAQEEVLRMVAAARDQASTTDARHMLAILILTRQQNRPQVEFDLQLGRYPQNHNSELFLSDRFSRADHHFPRIVYGADQHRHFCRPGCPLARRRAHLDDGRKLIRGSFGLPHIALQKELGIP
jgi:hypothetical protein